MGENGAGKTTLVKLLARLYDPDEGRILLDGHDLREYDLVALRANIGVIFQDFVRYHLTAADNIAVGRIEARDDRARIVAAAERSLADEVIRKLPQGYDQVLGKRFRTGIDLSGGEWQKVAIARAYMRDAQVLILDEPTAALDARAEFEVFQRFKELSGGQDGGADLAPLLQRAHGRPHPRAGRRARSRPWAPTPSCWPQRGRYAELFELQAAGYRCPEAPALPPPPALRSPPRGRALGPARVGPGPPTPPARGPLSPAPRWGPPPRPPPPRAPFCGARPTSPPQPPPFGVAGPRPTPPGGPPPPPRPSPGFPVQAPTGNGGGGTGRGFPGRSEAGYD